MMKLGLMVHHIRLTAMAVSLILAQVMPMGKAWAQPTMPSVVRTGEPLKALNSVMPNWQSDRILIKYKHADPKGTPDSTQSDRARVVGNRHGVQLKHVRRMSVGTDVWHLTRHLPMDQLRVMARELQDGDASIEYAEPDFRSVPAVNRQGGRASYSNYGSVVSLAAPGGDMLLASGRPSTRARPRLCPTAMVFTSARPWPHRM